MDRIKQRSADLVLTPLELVDRIAQLEPRRTRTGTATTGCSHQTRHSVLL